MNLNLVIILLFQILAITVAKKDKGSKQLVVDDTDVDVETTTTLAPSDSSTESTTNSTEPTNSTEASTAEGGDPNEPHKHKARKGDHKALLNVPIWIETLTDSNENTEVNQDEYKVPGDKNEPGQPEVNGQPKKDENKPQTVGKITVNKDIRSPLNDILHNVLGLNLNNRIIFTSLDEPLDQVLSILK